ncbi:hypothetical protein DL762_009277 [Monosporascus cannonballus]|uniref:Uncharacterized protein n=1 Tax=Monosporascus cannonballus TaxID=155416 RepID=A0ABY0GTU4_9PEZI|nr:hypothetical protein DL762_009277 [Monosporascus cannonballus]
MTSISDRRKETISNHTSELCTHHHRSPGEGCCDACMLRTTLSLETQAIVSSIEGYVETTSRHIGTLHRHEFPVPVPIPGSDRPSPTPQAAEAARAYLGKRSPAAMAELKLRVAVCHGEVGRAIGELRHRGWGAGSGSGEPEVGEDRTLIQGLERALENHHLSALEHARDRLWHWEESADRTAHGRLDIARQDPASEREEVVARAVKGLLKELRLDYARR